MSTPDGIYQSLVLSAKNQVPALYQVKFQFQIFALTIEIWHSCPSLSPPHLIRSISTLGDFHTERVLVGGRDHLPPLKKKPTFPHILARAHSMMLRSQHSGDHVPDSTQDAVTQRSWNYAGCIWQGCWEWESGLTVWAVTLCPSRAETSFVGPGLEWTLDPVPVEPYIYIVLYV